MAYGQGGWRRRRRNMYYFTGVPGWMRFGYSPGWVGRSPTGLPPTAQYLMQTGQVPQPYPAQVPAQISVPTHEDCANFRDGFCTLNGAAVDPSAPVCPSFTPKSSTPAPQTLPTYPMFQAPTVLPAQMPQIPKEQEIQVLEGQARMFDQQLEQIKRRIEELKREVK